ncbi:Hsp20/alpha crystallin family protein [Runella sp.]|jgi:HSP20 family protein|uniref:Hsp20/alpha crystallin family protein n=1 Tax=Runella sp. TaxID=1960881 RepID=UPI00260329B3|nr:Hsp20/alpha crystallin family protein [Runella sp.]
MHHHGRCGHGHPGMGYGHYGKQFGRNFSGGQFRVPVNVLKTDSTYEIYVIAPDRAKEDFKINLKGNELTISYQVKEEAEETKNWIRNEFKKASFERSFFVDETIDSANIKAEYHNGILQVTLPIVPGSEKPAQEIFVA